MQPYAPARILSHIYVNNHWMIHLYLMNDQQFLALKDNNNPLEYYN